MIPFSFLLLRMQSRINNMTCENKCPNCKCDKPCDFLPIDADLYVEIDDKTFLPSTRDPRN